MCMGCVCSFPFLFVFVVLFSRVHFMLFACASSLIVGVVTIVFVLLCVYCVPFLFVCFLCLWFVVGVVAC